MSIAIGVPRESIDGETRVSATPDTVRRLCAKGLEVIVEAGAGLAAHYADESYAEAGALLANREQALNADVIFKINKPQKSEIEKMRSGALLLSLLDMCHDDGTWEALARNHVDAIALELIPRISRAQTMDVLSSQANISGYRAVLESTALFGRFYPMMMTSAGSAKPARVLILGAGVAGLQALATARRLGAQVWGYDVRPEVREQIQSLGAKFVDLGLEADGSGAGGYAKQLSDDAQEREQALLGEHIKQADVVISTAQIPCMPAPILITEQAVRGMRAGSVIVDLAAGTGGNCTLTVPGKTVQKHGVIISGVINFTTLMPTDASNFFARNLYNLLELVLQHGDGEVDLARALEDEIVSCSLITQNGHLRFGDNEKLAS